MIKHHTLKPIVFDNNEHLFNLNNWVLLTDGEWSELDYNGDGEKYYSFELEWCVNEQTIVTDVEVLHDWVERVYEGDIDTPQVCRIIHNEVEIYITSIYNTETGETYNIDYIFKVEDLAMRLALYIKDEYYF